MPLKFPILHSGNSFYLRLLFLKLFPGVMLVVYMLNKNTLGVKKVRGQSEATYKQAGATKSFDIS